MKNSLIHYNVGPLLYCPADNPGIAHSIITERFGSHFSLALCLEDTIKDDCVDEAENVMLRSLNAIYQAGLSADFYLPQIFIRVRNPLQIAALTERLQDAVSIVSGFIIPKFSPDLADSYIRAMTAANDASPKKLYMMPILESPVMISLQTRYQMLYSIKAALDDAEDMVLNVRVGGNDLSHYFGLRRSSRESIYGMRPVSHLLSDILTVFSADYVISGPVWEYYQGNGWDTGLRAELREDRLSGFIGKTVIHPNQIALVNEAYKVSRSDLADAKAILNWDSASLVHGSVNKERMNEYKTHSNWALRTILLSEAYGIAEDEA